MSDPVRAPSLPHPVGAEEVEGPGTGVSTVQPSPTQVSVAVVAIGVWSVVWTLGLPAAGLSVAPATAELVQGLVNAALQTVGCVLVFRGAAVQTGRRRVAWTTIAFGALSGALGSWVWSAVLAATGEHPEQAAVDALYATALLLSAVGVAVLPPSDQRSQRVRTVDAAILMVAALTLMWVTPVHQQVDGRVIAGFATIDSFELVTVVTIMVAVGAVARCLPDRHGEIAPMAGALACSGTGMLLFASAPEGYPASSRLADVVFSVGFVLAAVAGLRLRGPVRPLRRRGSDRTRHWLALPELATVATLVALTVHERRTVSTTVTLLLGSTAVALAILRLLQLGIEQRRLSRSLHDSADQLYREARTDNLTSLGNRLALDEHLSTLLARRARLPADERRPVSVLYVDVDHFKRFNDALGHAVGDGLLVEVAHRIVRDVDRHAYRIGGDEFVAVVEDTDRAGALAHAADLVAGFGTPVAVHDHEMVASVSVGVTCWDAPDAPASSADLMRQADLALYRAKELGRGTWAAFDPALARRAQRQHQLRAGLQRAAGQDEFQVLFRPVACLRSQRLVGATAELHWDAPGAGLVGPDVIGPAALEGGLLATTIDALLSGVGRTLADTADPPQGAGVARPPWIGVRLSCDELVHPAAIDAIRAVVEQPGIEPWRLRVDITEDTVVDDRSHGPMAVLHELGVGVTVERFGTGPTSLLRLDRYPASAIRIDASFVHGLGRRDNDTVIVTSVAGLAAALGLELSADGVDEDFQCTYLDGLGFSNGTGRLFGDTIAGADLVRATTMAIAVDRSAQELAR